MCRLYGVNTATDSECYEEDWRSPIGDDVSDFSTQLRANFSRFSVLCNELTDSFSFLLLDRLRLHGEPNALENCVINDGFFSFLCGLWQKGETLDELNLHNCMLHQNLLAPSKWLESFISIMACVVQFLCTFLWLMECLGDEWVQSAAVLVIDFRVLAFDLNTILGHCWLKSDCAMLGESINFTQYYVLIRRLIRLRLSFANIDTIRR